MFVAYLPLGGVEQGRLVVFDAVHVFVELFEPLAGEAFTAADALHAPVVLQHLHHCNTGNPSAFSLKHRQFFSSFTTETQAILQHLHH